MSSDKLFKYIKDNLTDEGNDRFLLYRNDKDFWNDFVSPAEAVEFRNKLMCNSQKADYEHRNFIQHRLGKIFCEDIDYMLDILEKITNIKDNDRRVELINCINED